MKKHIGIRREDKNQWERRVPLIPTHARELIQNHPLEILLQPSAIRVFPDSDYEREGVKVEENLSLCSVIFALKEIPLSFFEKEKVYVFFSHTTKGQPYNMPMLKKMIDQQCTLIDYEKIIDDKGRRLLFFGREAGRAGVIDTLWALGLRWLRKGRKTPFTAIKQAHRYKSLVEAKEEVKKVGWAIAQQGFDPSLVPLVFGFAGYGHVSQGAQEVFDLLPFEEISPEKLFAFFEERNFFANRVYKVVFKEEHMVKPRSSDQKFDLQDYYNHPQKYKSVFESYLPYLTVLMNCIYWTPRYPRFVTKKFLEKIWKRKDMPRLQVIGDISCDVEGAMECTLHTTDPGNPVFVFDPLTRKATDGFKGRGVIVMAVDNLPCEISLESSIAFSQALKPFVPSIARADFSGDFAHCSLPDSVKRAVILYRGEFTSDYRYMKEFIKP